MKKKRSAPGGIQDTWTPFSGPLVDYKDEAQLMTSLLELLRKVNRPVGMDEILRITHLPRKAKKRIQTALETLQDEGKTLRSAGGWSCPSRVKHVQGVLSVQQAGMGFVTPNHGGSDIYIHPSALNGAWHGDTVEVLVLPGKRGPSVEGRITRVVERGQKELAAHAVRSRKDGLWMCAPANPRIQALFLTDVSELPKPVAEGDLLLLRVGEAAGTNLWEAVATANLEHEDSPDAQERITKSNHAIPGSFPTAVLEAVRSLPADPQEADYADRRDLRDIGFVTIDGRTARDFDDAIHVEKNGGDIVLRVAIADVSYYVRPDTPIDAEARLRGNSYYFPLSVEPMLPEALSNGLCSLRPLTPRLAMVAEMRFSQAGERLGSSFYPGVILSKARLTYGQIERGLLLGQEEDKAILAPHLDMLKQAETLARTLLERRKKRGTLDFDMPEPEYRFAPEGELVGVFAHERHFGHRIIEECMIAANEAVAEFLEHMGQPTLYRVHQPPSPDKMATVYDFIAQSGLMELTPSEKQKKNGSKTLTGNDLRRIIDNARGTPREYIVTRLILRSMMQARYQPENEGHFGLASDCYCHFTSPIRRYADLVVHRSLKLALKIRSAQEKPVSVSRLEAVADHINGTERTAVDAEREIHKRLNALFLRDKVGQEFTGIVSGVTDFGIFIELPQFMAEGMIRLSSLDDDFYEYYVERQELRGRGTNRVFRLGQTVMVRLMDVNLGRLEINFALAEGSPVEKNRASRPDSRHPKRLRDGITLTRRFIPLKRVNIN